MQKIYGRDETSGAYCGVHFFENRAALAAFRETELVQTIAAAYEAVEVRPEVYDVLYPLRTERGPFAKYCCALERATGRESHPPRCAGSTRATLCVQRAHVCFTTTAIGVRTRGRHIPGRSDRWEYAARPDWGSESRSQRITFSGQGSCLDVPQSRLT